MTAADDKVCYTFLNFRKKHTQEMIFHENRLPAKDSHEINLKRQNLKVSTVANYRWRFMG